MKYTYPFFLAFSSLAYSQLQIAPSADAFQLTNTLLGPNVEVFGQPVLIASPQSAGTFTGGLSAFSNGEAFNDGIILSTGSVLDAAGPNSLSGEGQDVGTDGSFILNQILRDSGDPSVTFNATDLTFQFRTEVLSDLSFNFIFASEEYNEFVNQFNDIFAFILTVDDDSTNDQHDTGERHNLAIVQGTQVGQQADETDEEFTERLTGSQSGIITNGSVVSINTVNRNVNESSFVNNDVNAADGGGAPDDNPSTGDPDFVAENHEFDGRTISLEASFQDLPAGVHEISLIIADSNDGILDSAVFLEADTFFIIPNSPVGVALPLILDANAGTLFHDINSRLQRVRASFPLINSDHDRRTVRSDWTPFQWYESPRVNDSLFRATGSYNFSTTTIPGVSSPAVNFSDSDFTVNGGSVGLEIDLSENFTLGAAYIYSQGDADLGSATSFEIENNAYAIYGTYFASLGQTSYFYLDALYGFLDGEIETTRDFDELGTTTGSASVSGNFFRAHAGISFLSKNVTHGPYLAYDRLSQESGTLREVGFGADTVPSIERVNSSLEGGYQASLHTITNIGHITYQGRVGYERSLESDSINTGEVSSFTPDENFFVGGLGVLWGFETGSFLSLDYEGAFGSEITSHDFFIRGGFRF